MPVYLLSFTLNEYVYLFYVSFRILWNHVWMPLENLFTDSKVTDDLYHKNSSWPVAFFCHYKNECLFCLIFKKFYREVLCMLQNNRQVCLNVHNNMPMCSERISSLPDQNMNFIFTSTLLCLVGLVATFSKPTKVMALMTWV